MSSRIWLRQSGLARSSVFGSLLRPTKASKSLTRNTEKGACRSELLQDAPFVAAIGACVLSSLVLQKNEKQHSNAPVGDDDVRNGAVTIISFIPLFNWLGWVFAWLDTNEPRYLFYASVYLAPYIRTGFSFSTDENWLLILSYFACIAHVQLEVSLQSGGIEGGTTFLQDGLRQLRQKVNLELPGKHSRTFHESASSNNEDTSLPAEEDFSKIELSEFDKELSGRGKAREVVESAKDPEKSTQSSEMSDE